MSTIMTSPNVFSFPLPRRSPNRRWKGERNETTLLSFSSSTVELLCLNVLSKKEEEER